ncbi:cytochrome P450 3A4 [Dendryphion nanum]|uniref:Cytochrome P450 3A4 n=1 Tax=Dendryphion nanum TaxID=256645 RepID=A0A9P9DCL2_9PLEO|nr:cytochrome P450 3A4 [Dendryphion nanum]
MEITTVHVFLFSLFQSAALFRLLPHLLPLSTFTSHFIVYSSINFTLLGIYHVIIYPFMLSPLRHLPTAKGWYPLLGHGMVVFSRPPGEAYLKMMKQTPNDDILHLHSFFHKDRLLLTQPSALAEVLVNKSYDWEKPPWTRTFLRMFLGDGLLVTEGDEHKFQRKQIMPSFSFRHIKELYPVFWAKALELSRLLEDELRDKPDPVLEFNHLTTQVTLDIIGLAGLGRDINSMRNASDALIENYEEMLEPTTEKAVFFILHLLIPPWLIRLLPWKLNERVRVITTNIKDICRAFVVDKRLKLKTEGKESNDILSLLIRSNNFSDDGLVDQLLTFLAAGHETTSSALTWTTYLLSTHPEVQALLRAEIHAAIPSPTSISPSSLSNTLESLPLLNAVLNETLRLYPTIPVSARIAVRNTSINSTFIPAGTLTFIVPWAINRSPSLWGPTASQFDPNRWIDPETGKVNYGGGSESNFSFLTFLHGPRSCIGERFARAELRALVAVVVAGWEVELGDGREVVPGGTLTSKPVGGLGVRFRGVKWGEEVEN